MFPFPAKSAFFVEIWVPKVVFDIDIRMKAEHINVMDMVECHWIKRRVTSGVVEKDARNAEICSDSDWRWARDNKPKEPRRQTFE